jgi:hypothetical protein
MKKMKWSSVFIAVLILALAPSAFAKLGESESTVDDDAQALGGQKVMRQAPQFNVHEITTSGTKIKEYVSPQGTVFGISWQGRVHPDLKVLLGSYYNEYQQSSGPHKKGRAPTIIKNSNFHFERSGHMRDLHGRAYLTSLIPTGLDDSVIQ